jgi:hypothetical protein
MKTDHKHAVTMEDWFRTHSAEGAKCGNCNEHFTATQKAKGVATIPNGAGCSMYVLCRPCARHFLLRGLAGIPNAVNDARLATLLHFMPPKGTA